MWSSYDLMLEAIDRRARLAEEAEKWRLIRWGGVIPPVPAAKQNRFRPLALAGFLVAVIGHLPAFSGRTGQ